MNVERKVSPVSVKSVTPDRTAHIDTDAQKTGSNETRTS